MGTTSSQYEDTVNFTDKRKGPTKKKAFVKDHADASTKDDEPTNAKSGSKSLKKPKIEVDQIDQEQARQDLMAYLEIVGENADDLPLTWRDDPELGRSVSSLTAKQYATKADAFIPCDVRVISTTCTRYGGSTWTLPNKEVR
jgi:Tfp pilus assembly protein PilF